MCQNKETEKQGKKALKFPKKKEKKVKKKFVNP
jgi:hypothetical protein